jgi:hypothetical protein
LPKQPAQTCCTVDIVSISPWSRFRPPCLGHISTKKKKKSFKFIGVRLKRKKMRTNIMRPLGLGDKVCKINLWKYLWSSNQ